MIQIKDKSECCGCTACQCICPTSAIKMTADTEGFLYPVVDEDKCVGCNMCNKVCPIISPVGEMVSSSSSSLNFAIQNTNEDILKKSSSGGVFTILAEHVIDQGGVVFGAEFNDKWEVVHNFARTMEEVERFRGSKYVQSKLGYTFNKVRAMLTAGTPVLFTGTPCQVAGLKSYLKKDYDKLITMDFICHGVPSPKAWHIYLNNIAKNKDITDIQFRDKSTGWKDYSFTMKADGRTITEPHSSNIFMKAFLSNMFLRPSCYTCKFKSPATSSDVTVGDFWGLNILHPEFDDDKGCCAVMVHTDKAMEILKNADSLKSMNVTFDEITKYNSSSITATSKPKHRDGIFKILLKTRHLPLTIHIIELKNFLNRFFAAL